MMTVMTMLITSCMHDHFDDRSTYYYYDDGTDEGGCCTGTKTTIMVYGVGGATLDYQHLQDFCEMIPYGATDEVNVVFQYKLSAQYQYDSTYKQWKGVMNWDLADQNGRKPDETSLLTMLQQLNGTIYKSDPTYNMTTADALKDFINDASKYYPADRYVLFLVDHGGGWRTTEDGKGAMSGKAIVYDDNDDNGGNTYYLTTGAVRNAIANSNIGKVNTLITYACNMSQWEALYDWKDVTNYVVASNGPSYRECMYALLELYKQDLTDAEILPLYCDAVVKNEQSSESGNYLYFTDMGCYDMSKMSTMQTIIGEVASMMKSSYGDATFKAAADYATRHAIVCNAGDTYFYKSQEDGEAAFQELYNAITTNCPKLNATYKYVYDKQGAVSGYEINSDFIRIFQDQCPEKFSALKYESVVLQNMTNSEAMTISLADFLYQLRGQIPATNVAYANVNNLYEKYMTQLKDMSYSNMTHSETGDAYLQCSPSIIGYSLNEEGWVPWTKEMVWTESCNVSPLAANYKLSDIISYYQVSTFDKLTGWSGWLKTNTVNPHSMINDSRSEKYYRLK